MKLRSKVYIAERDRPFPSITQTTALWSLYGTIDGPIRAKTLWDASPFDLELSAAIKGPKPENVGLCNVMIRGELWPHGDSRQLNLSNVSPQDSAGNRIMSARVLTIRLPYSSFVCAGSSRLNSGHLQKIRASSRAGLRCFGCHTGKGVSVYHSFSTGDGIGLVPAELVLCLRCAENERSLKKMLETRQSLQQG